MDPKVLRRLRSLAAELCQLLDELEDPPPSNVVALKAPEEIELEGIIGRPQLTVVKGHDLWTAGLGIKNGPTTRWIGLVAWDNLALLAAPLVKGQLVRVVGVSKISRFVNGEGVLTERQELTVSFISPVSASSGSIA